MKSVMISIQPKWCELIASGEKTAEVRKTRPKIDVPFKCYIYCTKDKHGWFDFLNKTRLDGKVIGEFVCDRIDDMRDVEREPTCLTIPEWLKYTDGHKGIVYGWHISDIVIYDEPKELSEFVVEGDCSCNDCNGCKWFERGNGYNVEDDCRLPYEYDFKSVKPLKRPFQSWGYVEGLELKL